jgi:hypothetical protein
VNSVLGKIAASLKDELPGFALFWEAYPNNMGGNKRKKKRPQCIALWKRLGCEKIYEVILRCLEYDKRSEQWVKQHGAFIPGPHPWLMSQAWLEEPDRFVATLADVFQQEWPDAVPACRRWAEEVRARGLSLEEIAEGVRQWRQRG